MKIILKAFMKSQTERERIYYKIGLMIPDILLPSGDVDIKKWSVIACDQHITDEDYWLRVERYVGEAASTLKLICPEACLGRVCQKKVNSQIQERMRRYLSDDTLVAAENGVLLVERQVSNNKQRLGVIVALDLERYDPRPVSDALIRSTEGTYMDKLSARMEIREGAVIEVPHILVLIDDPEKEVIETLFKAPKDKLYDFELMMDGGRLRYYLLKDQGIIGEMIGKLENMVDTESFEKRYGIKDKSAALYMMGDGNHSFAAAQKIWERTRRGLTQDERKNHPARYALVELVNIHSEGIEVEPIHRVMEGVDPESFLDEMGDFFFGNGSNMSIGEKKTQNGKFHQIPYIFGSNRGVIRIENPTFRTESESLEEFLKYHVKKHPQRQIKFIHGEDVVELLSSKPDTIGFFLPKIRKSEIFKNVIRYGAYPRKSISLGHARDKKYYLESRRIIQ